MAVRSRACLNSSEGQTVVVICGDLLVLCEAAENGECVLGGDYHWGELEDEVEIVPGLEDYLVLDFLLCKRDVCVGDQEVK